MNVEHLSSDSYEVSEWTGGKTTELFLFPELTSYSKRNFEIRISSATIELAESTFSDLTGYRRTLIPLTDPITLIFDNAVKRVNPFQQVQFAGSEAVRAHGCTTDFNVMTSPRWQQHLTVIETNSKISFRTTMVVFYLVYGNLELKIQNSKGAVQMIAGDFVAISDAQEPTTVEVLGQHVFKLLKVELNQKGDLDVKSSRQGHP
ncbi:hypothetical protein FC83_GL001804 [Agrilactobacillus composti DSM 18527 = JCM 14202]|uniref:HutD-family protein n=1 Tax=Agrilactobacillus composti DSM 18527 = JCM 14202 TaxID=1423734 RepID=A0A0R1XVA4_9LACO|nr:HutD family protein [Agrilactobacillus composti]KRM30668.1 hypothetical protein FC83_GL001804 [Agrilactobacillus composti DSM 18527 = JCM 14202]